jgi:hypothetical protein
MAAVGALGLRNGRHDGHSRSPGLCVYRRAGLASIQPVHGSTLLDNSPTATFELPGTFTVLLASSSSYSVRFGITKIVWPEVI